MDNEERVGQVQVLVGGSTGPELGEKKEARAGSRSTGDDDDAVRSARNGDSHSEPSNQSRSQRWLARVRRYRHVLVAIFHLVLFVVMTGWWIAGLILHRRDRGWVVPFLVWLAFSLRLLTFHVSLAKPVHLLLTPVRFVWNAVIGTGPVSRLRDGRGRHLPLAFVTVAVILIGTFATAETADNTRANRAASVFGLLVFMVAFYVTSRDRSCINWRAVLGGMLAQFLLGLFVLRTGVGYDVFNFLGNLAKTLLAYSGKGTAFLTSSDALATGWFLVSVLPAIIFFVAFVHLLHHWGWIQWLVGHFASVFFYLLGISGAEAVVAAASPFIGQGESAVLIRSYMSRLTSAEIHQIMTSGFATIAGSVLSAYISMGVSPLVLISSCVMSIPASISLSKLRYPEDSHPVTAGRAVLRNDEEQGDAAYNDDDGQEEQERPYNSLHAVANGSWLGIKIAGMVAASVLCILALLGLVNGLLGWWGGYIEVPQLSIELILGYLLYPVSFLLGVDSKNSNDLRKVAQLIGIKVVANEFVAYNDLTTGADYAALSSRSQLIAQYALCGFGNFSAVGIQIGALSQLAPKRVGDVARVAMSALITGIIATLTSASIAGMLISNEAALMKLS